MTIYENQMFNIDLKEIFKKRKYKETHLIINSLSYCVE